MKGLNALAALANGFMQGRQQALQRQQMLEDRAWQQQMRQKQMEQFERQQAEQERLDAMRPLLEKLDAQKRLLEEKRMQREMADLEPAQVPALSPSQIPMLQTGILPSGVRQAIGASVPTIDSPTLTQGDLRAAAKEAARQKALLELYQGKSDISAARQKDVFNYKNENAPPGKKGGIFQGAGTAAKEVSKAVGSLGKLMSGGNAGGKKASSGGQAKAAKQWDPMDQKDIHSEASAMADKHGIDYETARKTVIERRKAILNEMARQDPAVQQKSRDIYNTVVGYMQRLQNNVNKLNGGPK